MVSEPWSGHVFEARAELLDHGHVRLLARADGGRFEVIETSLEAAARSDFARQNPGSTWLPLGRIPFTITDDEGTTECVAEFDASLYSHDGLKHPYRYRVLVGDVEVASGQGDAKAAGGSVAFALMWFVMFGVVLLMLWTRS